MPCVGDCDGNSEVTVDEILKGVSIALGENSVRECQVLDSDNDGQVTIDEIVISIARALNGCSIQ